MHCLAQAQTDWLVEHPRSSRCRLQSGYHDDRQLSAFFVHHSRYHRSAETPFSLSYQHQIRPFFVLTRNTAYHRAWLGATKALDERLSVLPCKSLTHTAPPDRLPIDSSFYSFSPSHSVIGLMNTAT